jgi:hypothetical protein
LIQKFDQRLNETGEEKKQHATVLKRPTLQQTGFVLVANPDPRCRNPIWIKGEKIQRWSSKGLVKDFLSYICGRFQLVGQFADFFNVVLLKKFYIFSQEILIGSRIGSLSGARRPIRQCRLGLGSLRFVYRLYARFFVVTVKDKLDVACCTSCKFKYVLLLFRNLANQETARQPDMQSQDQLFFDLMQRFRYPYLISFNS